MSKSRPDQGRRDFTRRTYLFVMGTLIKNGYSAVFNNSNQQAPNPGEDVRQIGVGLHTAF